MDNNEEDEQLVGSDYDEISGDEMNESPGAILRSMK